jgi:hypothetical protein
LAAEGRKISNDNLGVTFLVDFTTAHGGGVVPIEHNAVGIEGWAEIEAKNGALTSRFKNCAGVEARGRDRKPVPESVLCTEFFRM